MAYFELEPFGAGRDNMHSAQIASLIYNSHRSKRAKPLETTDFMFKDEYSRREHETTNFLAGLRTLAKPKVH